MPSKAEAAKQRKVNKGFMQVGKKQGGVGVVRVKYHANDAPNGRLLRSTNNQPDKLPFLPRSVGEMLPMDDNLRVEEDQKKVCV